MHLDHNTAAEGQTLEITQMALALVLRLRLDISREGAVLLYYGVMHELWHWMGGSASIGRKYTQMRHLESPMEAVWIICYFLSSRSARVTE